MPSLPCLLLLLLAASPAAAKPSLRSLAWPFTGIILDAKGLDMDMDMDMDSRIAMSSMPLMPLMPSISLMPSNCVRAILNCCEFGREGGR